MRLLLDFVYLIACILLSPWLVYRLCTAGRRDFAMRFGVGLRDSLASCIWLHGSSAGEVAVTFEACPRPEGAADPPTPALLTSEALYVEHAIIQEIDVTGVSTNGDWFSCVARALVDDPTFTALTS